MTPTIKSIAERIKSRLGLVGGRGFADLTVEKVYADVFAAAMYMAYKMIEVGVDSFFPDTAGEKGVLRWGGIFGLERIRPTHGEVTVQLKPTSSEVIISDDIVIRSQNGVEYEFLEQIAETQARFLCKDIGNIEMLKTGDTVFLNTTQKGFEVSATVQAFISGVDEETLDNYRERIIQRFKFPPMGGAKSDYVRWCREIEGVTDCYITTDMGKVTIYPLFKDRDEIIPTDKEIMLIQEHIDDERPVTAKVFIKKLKESKNQTPIRMTPELMRATKKEDLNREFKKFLIHISEPARQIKLIDIQRFLVEYMGIYEFGDLGKIDYRPEYDEIMTRIKFDDGKRD